MVVALMGPVQVEGVQHQVRPVTSLAVALMGHVQPTGVRNS